LAKEGNTDLLSAPKLTTRSGTPATVQIISEYTYPTDVTMMTIVTTNGGEVMRSLAAMPCKFEVREVGVTLDVTPTLDKNTGMIGLQLTASVVNEPKWMDSTITRLGPDGADHEAVISLPFFAARSINTSLSMKDGETALITGSRCKIKSVRQVEDRVPVVGSIPILGRAFCSSTTVEEDRWLLVAVTARRVD
jgi:general secretion pathway protein D